MKISRIQRFKKNQEGRDFVVGDIHGCYTLLMSKLENIEFDFKKDRLFSVGDLIDRGNENEKCLELIYEKWFFPVIGNHELLMIDALLNEQFPLWFRNFGNWILRSDLYFDDALLFAKEIDLLLPLAIEITDGIKTYGIIHADIKSDWNDVVAFCEKNHSMDDLLNEKNISKKDLETFHNMTWGRKRHKKGNTTIVKNIDEIFVGHTIVDEPFSLGNVHFIDTGGFKNNNITVKEIIF